MGKTIREFAKEISILMPQVMREFTRQHPEPVEAGDITMAQMGILLILKDTEGYRMSELAKLIAVTTSATTGMADRMVRSGLLKRARDPKDRRVVNIRITAKGKKAINAIMRQKHKAMTNIFKDLTSKEREAYLNTVKKIYAIMMRKAR